MCRPASPRPSSRVFSRRLQTIIYLIARLAPLITLPGSAGVPPASPEAQAKGENTSALRADAGKMPALPAGLQRCALPCIRWYASS